MSVLAFNVQNNGKFRMKLRGFFATLFSKLYGREESNSTGKQLSKTKRSADFPPNDEFINSLFVKYRQMMFKTAMGILHNGPDAEDVVQDAFLWIINNLEKISQIPCRKIPFYFASIIENLAINFLNKKNRHPTEDIDEHFELAAIVSVEKNADATLLLNEVKSALGELSDRDYSLIFLSAFEQMTPKEIAEELNISVKNVYASTERARKRLLKILKERGIEYVI